MSNTKRSDIAIVGMACWYPGAKSLVQLWENVLAKRQEFRRILDSRLPLSEYHSAKRTDTDKTYGTRAAYIDGFDFDWMNEKFPKSTFESTDFVQWLALDVASKAIQDAGMDRKTVAKDKTGVILGNSLTGEFSRANGLRLRWPYVRKVLLKTIENRGFTEAEKEEFLKATEDLFKSVLAPQTADSLPGNMSNIIAGRICNYFNFDGGGYVIDGACSSSLLAVANAANGLATGDLNMAIAGGVDVSLDAAEMVGFSRVGALTENEMKVYDRNSNGFIGGEGCGMIVLKRLDDAVRDGNKIYAVVKGWGISSDGSGGIATPKSSTQALALKRAYERAGYSPADCNFIEGHGTGTTVGDKIELQGIGTAVNDMGGGKPKSIGMTSFKSIIGHTKAAAGIGALIKTAIALNRRILPPTAGCEEPNAVFSELVSLFPLMQGEVLSSHHTLRAGVSAMGFGGINSHVTLESYGEPHSDLKPELDERALMATGSDGEVFLFSSQTVEGLSKQVQELLLEAPHISVGELADLSAHVCRKAISALPYRAALVAGSVKDLELKLKELQSLLAAPPAPGESKADPLNSVWFSNKMIRPKVGFLFPGQGSQRLNMARTLVERYPWAQEIYDEVNLSMKKWIREGRFSDFIFRPVQKALNADEVTAWASTLTKTENAQPAICFASILWARRLAEVGIHCDIVGGHSLGELTALSWAGAYDYRKLIELAAERGHQMASKGEASMASLACGLEVAEEIVEEVNQQAQEAFIPQAPTDGNTALQMKIPPSQADLVIANINGLQQIVISGTNEKIGQALKIAASKGVSATQLNVSNAFHSPLVASAAQRFGQNMDLPFNQPPLKIPFVSGVDGKRHSQIQNLKNYLCEQITSPVKFTKVIEEMSQHCDMLVEVGPGSVLTGLANNFLGKNHHKAVATESRAEKQSDFLKVVARYFALGGTIHVEKLFHNRLIRPYQKFSQKQFFTNPCEIPFPQAVLDAIQPRTVKTEAATVRVPHKVVQAAAFSENSLPAVSNTKPLAGSVQTSAQQFVEHEMTRDEVKAILLETLSKITGFPADVFKMNMRLLDDLNLDSIKAGEAITQLAAVCKLENALDPIQIANSNLDEIIDIVMAMKPRRSAVIEGGSSRNASEHLPTQEMERVAAAPGSTLVSTPVSMVLTPSSPATNLPTAMGRDQVKSILIDSLTRVTGFPPETFQMNMRLLDDLNLDSIKAGEVISEITTRCELEGNVDPIQLANSNLEEIIELLVQLKSSEASSASEPSVTVPTTTVTTSHSLYLTRVLEATVRLTGFSAQSLKPEMEFGTDLRVDRSALESICRDVCAQFSIPASVDVTTIPGCSIKKLAEVIEAIHQGHLKASQVFAKPSISPEASQGQDTWVRNFTVKMVPKARTSAPFKLVRHIDQWTNAKVLLVHDNPTHSFAETLSEKMLAAGASVASFGLEEAQRLGAEALSEYDYFVYLMPQAPEDTAAPEECLKIATRRLHFIGTVANSPRKPRRYTTIGTIQFGDGLFGQGAFVQKFDASSTSAFLQTAIFERNDIRARSFEISLGGNPNLLAENLLQELTGSQEFAMVGFDEQGQRYQAEMEVSFPDSYSVRDLSWSKDDVMLVTGGAKGVTAECAAAFAIQNGVKLAIIGSSPLPNENDPQGEEILLNLKRLKGEGIQHRYYSCDVSKSAEVEKVVAEIQRELGPITAILHGAGKNNPRRISQASVEMALDEISPKLLGVMNLARCVPVAPLKMFIGLTSILGVQGGPGNAWYGFSNEALNTFLLDYGRKNHKVQIATLAYGLWDGVGMALRLDSLNKLKKYGMTALSAQEGVARFLKLTSHHPGVQQVVITSRMPVYGFQTSAKNTKMNGMRFLEDIKAFLPGVETVARARLTIEKDLYLHDHKYNGTYLFPTVMGLEAMAQAALQTLGLAQFEKITFDNLQLTSAIVVNPSKGTEIEIFCVADENIADSIHKTVHVGIRSENSGFTKSHFSATLRFHAERNDEDQPQSLPGADLGIDIKNQVYGPLLFHGPTYQRIEKIHELTADHVFFSTRQESNSSVQTFADPSYQLVLGDAYYRDSLLQGGQCLTPQSTALPVSCQRIAIFSTKMESTTRYAKIRLLENDGKTILYTGFVFNQQGQVLESWNYIKSAIVKTKAMNPTVEALAMSGKAPSVSLEQQISSRLRSAGLKSVIFARQTVPQLPQMTKDERHQAESDLLLSTFKAHFGEKAEPQLHWHPSGKPYLKGKHADLKVSFSHANEECVLVVDSEDVGCDLEAVTPREASSWASLLGPKASEILKALVEKAPAQLAMDVLATMVWSAREAAGKAFEAKEFQFDRVQWTDAGALFHAQRGEVRLQVFAMVTSNLSPDLDYVLSIALTPQKETADGGLFAEKLRNSYSLGMNPDSALCARWPVTFKEASSVQRTAHFAKFFEWQGRVRELALLPMLSSASEIFKSGEFGWVTNNSETKIYRSIEVGDVIEGRLKMGPLHGKSNSSVNLFFEWFRLSEGKPEVLIAQSRMLTTWVKVISHGVVEVAPFPKEFVHFFEVTPHSEGKESFQRHMVPQDSRLVYQAPPGIVTGPLLTEKVFSTALEESNLVGNVYFSNYSSWLGKTRDMYFQSLSPEAMMISSGGELFCTHSYVNHLRELMPFEQVLVEMRLKSLTENGASLYFEFFKFIDGKKGEKLAYGGHEFVWAKKSRDELKIGSLPEQVLKGLMDAIAGNETNDLKKSS